MHYHLRQAHASKSHVSQMRASGFLLRSCMATGALLGDVILCPLLESYKKQACEASHLKTLLLPEASDTSWKPANSTYDTSTCNLVQDQSHGKYFLSIWKLHEDFCKLFADGEKLPKKPSQWLRHVIKSLPGVDTFRGQRLIGNLLLLTHGFPRGCWAVLIPKPLYAFVDETEHCNLSEFRPIISKRNTLAIMRFFFMERSIPKRLSNGMLNLEKHVVITHRITDGQALDKLCEVYDVLQSIKAEALKCKIIEENSSAHFELGKESHIFAPMEYLTNLCMAEHVRTCLRLLPKFGIGQCRSHVARNAYKSACAQGV